MKGFFKYGGSTDINSGTGKINISALATTPQTNATAVGFYINGGTNHYFTSASPSADAIKIVGDASESNSSFSEGIILTAATKHEFVATGIDGGVNITSKAGSNDSEGLQINDPTYVLANGGDIKISVASGSSSARFYSDSGGDLTLGYTDAANTNYDLTSSTSDIILNASGSYLYSGEISANTNGGNFILSGDTDNSGVGTLRMAGGLDINTHGGNITLGGGNTLGTGYAIGENINFYTEGVRIDNVLSLNSDGGNISIKGKTSNLSLSTSGTGNSGFGIYSLTSNGVIDSGTGTITIKGVNQNPSFTDYSSGIVFALNGGKTTTISSSNTSENAIQISAIATGPNASNFGMEIETNSPLVIAATGEGGGVTLNTVQNATSTSKYELVARSELQVLANGGDIKLIGGKDSSTGGRLYFSSHPYFGSKSGSLVTSSSSDILLRYNTFEWGTINPRLATSGRVTIEPFNSSFTHTALETDWFSFNQNSQTMSGLTIGKEGNSSNITHNTYDITVAGPISMLGGVITIDKNLTSSSNGDIFLKGISGANGDVVINSGDAITKSGGTGTLTLQGHGRVINYGTISSIGTAQLNVVMWSDYDNDNNDGGVSQLGTINTNGGHVWLGGSSTNGGTYTWNGLSVGNGPSIGSIGFNWSALNLLGSISTNGGDFFAWAGDGYSSGIDGIATNGESYTINAINGDITLITDQVDGSGSSSLKFKTTGKFNLTPNGGSFNGTFNFNPVISGDDFEFPGGDFNYLRIQNSANLSGLTIGEYLGTGLEGDSVFNITNSSDVTISTLTTISGPISIYGGDITLTNSLTASGTLLIQSSGAVTQAAAVSATTLTLQGSGTFTLNNSNNEVQTLIAGTSSQTTGNVSFTNKDALTIGDGSNGVLSSGTVSIGTLSGNLTITEDIETNNTSASAIKLYADQGEAAGSKGQGNIIISGTPTLTTGSGGRASLFSGKPASSTGLVNLVGSNNVRIGVDSNTTTFEPGLNSGVYALFRTGPEINLSETSLSFAHTSGTNSLPKSFVLSATGLTENVTLTAPNGFEISETENSGYTSSLNMTQSSGSISNAPIYVRVKNSASGCPTGTLSATSEGAFSESLGLTTTANAALDLDGVDDYVDTGSTILTTGQNYFTIEAWVYSKNPENDNLYHGIIGVQETSRSPSIWIKNRSLHYDFRNTTATGTQIGALFSFEDIRANKWFHIAWVKSGTLTYFYVNGKKVIDGNPAPSNLYVDPENYRLGYINNYFKGQLDEVRFWNTARTQEQIQENMYRSLYGNSHSGLISSYNFNNGVPLSDNSSNTTLYDAVGNNDGTLTNFGNLSIASATTSTWVANPFPESEIPNGYSSMPIALWNAIGTNETRDSNGLTLTAPSTLSAENYVNLAANTDTGTTTSDVGNTENIRSNRIWYVNEMGSVSATVKIGVASATGQTVSSFVSPTFSLIRRDGTSEDFSRVAQGTRSGDVVTFTEVGLEDGYYSLGVVQNVLLIPTASQSKTLGAEEPTLSYTTSPNVSLSGTLSRTAGEDVGTYSITIGTISSSLYSITLAPENFEIVVTDPNINGWNDLSLTFGDTSGVPSYTTSATTSPSFTSSNTSVAAIHPSSGTITATGVGTTTLWIYFPAGGQFVSGTKSLTITVLARTITVTAAAKTKVFGESDPELTYTATPAVGDPVVAGSSATVSFTGTLIRTDGENAGTYSITLGTLSNTNYTIDYVGADFSITKAPTDIDDGDSDPATETLSDTTITFGDADLLLTPTSSNTADYTFTSSDSSVASITTTSTNTASIRNMGVGSAVISISQAADPNYQAKTVSYTLTVNRLPVTVIPTTTQSKTYGEADLTLTYDSSPELNSSLSNSSTITFTGTLSRTDGTNVGTYSITIGTLTNTNYALTFTETDYTINQRPITISAEAKTKVYGSADPSLTHSITAGSIVTGDTVSGVLTRTSGEAAGTYSIAQNTLTYGNNYNETYEAADLTITNATLTLTVSDYTKVYDSQFIDSSNLSFTATGLVNGNSIDDLVGTPTYTVAGTATNTVGTYSITLSGLSHPSYDIVFVGANATIMQRDMSEVIVADISDRVYNGLAQTLSPTASLNSLSLVEGTDYTTSFTGNTNVGTASVTLTGLGNFTGSKTVPFKIVAANIASTTITGLPSQTFTGFTLTPSPSLSYNGNLLVESSDYSVSYKGNTNAGTASVTFIGSGNYTGTHVIGFEIEKADLNISFENITTTFGAIDFKPSLTISDTSTIPILSPSANTNPRFWYANSIYGDARIFYPSDYERKETFFKPSLNSERSWIAEGSGSSYLALDLQEEVLIYGIKTKGNARNPKWVKTAKIQYTSVLETSNISDVGREKIGESNWTTIEENASLNTDNTTAVINLFESPVTARYLNVLPSSHQVDVSMRLGVLYIPGNLVLSSSNSSIVSFSDNIASVNGGGIATVTATIPESLNYNAYSTTFTIEVESATPSINFPNVTKTFGDVPFALTATSSNTSNKIFTVSNTDVATVSGDTITIVGAGTTSVTLTQEADGNYTAATATMTLVVNKATPSFTVSDVTKIYGDLDFAIDNNVLISNSPGSIVYTSSDTSVATISGTSNVHNLGSGSTIITASQSATDNYLSGTTSFTLIVNPLEVNVLANAKTKVHGDADPVLNITSSPSLGTVLSNGDNISFTGTLSRTPGENVGIYPISIGTLTNTNYDITFTPANLSITKLPVTITPTSSQSKTYGEIDTTLTFTASPAVNSTLTNTTSTITFTGSLSRTTGENVNNYTINIGTLTNTNYNITLSPETFVINKKTITVSGITAGDKVYDANTNASVDLSGITFTGKETGDTITATVTGTFDTKDIGTGKTVSLSATYSSSALDNYTIVDQSSTTASITAKTITATLSGTVNKTYNSTTSATLSAANYELSGFVAGESATITQTFGAYDSKNVGTNKEVSVSLSNAYAPASGTLLSNYILAATATGTVGNITAKTLTVTNITALDKVYDGSTNSNINSSTIVYNGLESGDDVSINSTSGVFDNENVGVNKTVSLTNAYTGADLSNYALVDQASATASITVKTVSASLIGSVTKVYNGTLSATLNPSNFQVNGVIPGESIGVTATQGTYDTKEVGANKMVTIDLTDGYAPASGTLISNYALAATATGTVGTITAQTLTVTGIVVLDKVYDGTVSSTVMTNTIAYEGLAAGDNVYIDTSSGVFADANVGQGKTVNLTNTYAGTDLTNYTVVNQATTTASITAKPITIIPTASQSKTYGEVNTPLTYTISPSTLPNGTAISLGGTLSRTIGENVGTYTITIGTVSNTNYDITLSPQTFAINKKTITVSGITAGDKVYDANTTSSLDLSGITFTGKETGDTITVTVTGTFDTKDIGTAKTVSLSATYSSSALDNYTIVDQSSTTASITAKTVSVTGSTGINKTYDGNTNLPLGEIGYGSLTGVIGSEDVTLSGVGVYDAASVGSRTIAIGTVTLTGADKGNYSLNWTNGSGTISKKTLTVTANNDAKFVGESDTPAYNGVSYSGFEGSDSVSDINVSGLAITRSNSSQNDAGSYPGILVPSGVTASNYDISYVNGDYTIIPADKLLLKVTNQTTTYGTSATYTITSAQYYKTGTGLVNLTVPTPSAGVYPINDGASTINIRVQPASPVNSTAGKLAVGTYGLRATVVSGSSGNFSNNIEVIGSHSVAKKSLTATASGVSKVYDATTAMNGVSLGLNGLETADVVTVNGTGSFSSPNAGTDLSYTIAGLSLAGADADNYYLSAGASFSGTNGVITKAPLTVTANNDNGVDTDPAYSGGNGVAYTGFKGLDGVSDLGGTLSYTGSSQGATSAGTYTIVPGGLTSSNYSITFVAGTLTIIVGDSDGDGVRDPSDNCPTTPNADQADADGDGIGDVCDNAPGISNPDQRDTDADGIGDVADPDDDNDGCPDTSDAFPLDPSECSDNDGDGIGDNADTDDDNDGVLDTVDNCAFSSNADQSDIDADGIGDVCDTDIDGDGWTNDQEQACGSDPNSATDTLTDFDQDGLPDCSDPDDDNDGYLDANDAFPLDPSEWVDNDADGIGNNADTDDDNDGQSDEEEIFCGTDPLDASSFSGDIDADGITDCRDTDNDNDGVNDASDAFPLDPAEWTDTDADGIGNNADTDDDGDGYSDLDELECNSNPLDANELPADLDGDGIPDCKDTDIDGDGCINTEDVFPRDPSECQDTDGDGLGDNVDVDDDGDGVIDSDDAFPLDPSETKDSDGDGIGDNADTDDNNDGFDDEKVVISGLLTPNSSGMESTWKIINIEQYPNARVSVFDKNGMQVFRAQAYKNDWRGTYKNSADPLPAGSYLYRLNLGDGSPAKEGWLYIQY